MPTIFHKIKQLRSLIGVHARIGVATSAASAGSKTVRIENRLVAGMPVISRFLPVSATSGLKSAWHSVLVCSALALGLLGTAQAAEPASAAAPMTIDDLGFGTAMDQQVFVNAYRVESNAAINSRGDEELSVRSGLRLNSVMEFSADNPILTRPGLYLSGDPADNEQGISVRRFSTSLQSSRGTLTVGSDWTNFQDFLPDRNLVQAGGYQSSTALDSISNTGLTSQQISWNSSNGIGVALEKDYRYVGPDASRVSLADDDSAESTNLVLSWRGSTLDQRGQYSFSALGRELELDGFEDGDSNTATGWGLNLAGGWHFGDLFAALSVTLGNSIDSFILGRLGDRQTAAAASKVAPSGQSININPSLSDKLGDNSTVHFAVNSFQRGSGNAAHGVDTLDTVHLGYSWNPWPSTLLGIEFVGKDVEGRGEMADSNEVNFAASKRF